MASTPQSGFSASPDQPGWRGTLRRWAGLLIVIAVLLVLLIVATAVGWVEWLIRHPGQAWLWVIDRWLASSALAVVVAGLGVWVTWAGPRAQQRRKDARADAERVRAEADQAAERQVAWERRCRSVLQAWPLPRVEDADPFTIGVFYLGSRGGRNTACC